MRDRSIDAARALAAAGVLLSAAVHLELWDLQGFRDIDVIGPLFLLNAVSGLVIGVMTLMWRHWFPALISAGFGLVTVVAFWISVVHGLFGLKEVASGSAQLLAEVAELVSVVCGLFAAGLLWQDSRHRAREPDATRG